ncbi:MAG: HAMP domain-containing sensor histidine kinase, partial [Candidatus Kapaibacterium sp.]
KSVDKLELFIEEVIQYSRNARMPVQRMTFDFGKFVSDILLDHQYLPNFNKIEINVVDEIDEEIRTDEMRLKIILNNLISNAIKFHRFDNGIKPRIDISISADSLNYFISVADNGRGIQSEFVEKIFEMFFRGTEETQGSGLGLYILKETVMRLEGKIDVKSEIGKGTTFCVTIPKVIP